MLLTSTLSAQISDIKIEGSYAKIYDINGRTGNNIYLGDKILLGYTTQFILIQEGSYLKIYNERGSYTGNSISIDSNRKYKGFNQLFIIISEGSYTKYYNFSGRYIDQTHDSN